MLSLWALGQVARDATFATGLLFYVPSLLWGLALAALALVWRLRRRPALWSAVAALAPLAVALALENRWRAIDGIPEGGAKPLRIVHWNVAGAWHDAEAQRAEIARWNPDVVVLSEAPERAAAPYRKLFPNGSVGTFGALTVASRAPVSGTWLARSRELQAVEVQVGAPRELALLVVNLASSPRIARAPLLAQVMELARQHRPDLVVGDFNAPRRSRALSNLPPGYRHAYLEAGSGWSATWPVPLPLLAIDQMIVGPRLRPLSYRLRSTPWSDHRLQYVDLVARNPG